MANSPHREVIERLGAFLRLRSKFSDEDIDSSLRDLASRLAPNPDGPVGDGRNRPFVLGDAESIEVPQDVCLAPAQQHASTVKTAERNRAGNGRTRGQEPESHLAAHVSGHYQPTRVPISFPDHAVAAADLPAPDVYKRIAHLIDYVTDQIRAGELPYLDVPDAHSANAIYDDRGNVFLGHKLRRLTLDSKEVMAFMRLLLTLELAFENVQRGSHVTKRGLYYYHQTKLPDERCEQESSDRALSALSNILQVRRKTLGFVEARRGSIYGRLVIRSGTEVVNVSQLGPAGWSVPRFTDDVEILGSDATFILIVEKEAIAFRLVEAQWFNLHPSIIVCGNGFPSYSTREFTRRLVETLHIPAFVCVDADPGGVRVALTYAHGAISTAMETPWLACNDIWWAGLHPSDVDRFGLGSDTGLRLESNDFEAAKALLSHPSDAYVNKRVREELALMIDRRTKTELEAISVDLSFFVGEYLPRKLFDTDLVKL